MTASENNLIAASALTAVAVLLGILLCRMEYGAAFRDWNYLHAFIFWVIMGYAIPQALFMRKSDSELRASGMTPITLILVMLAGIITTMISGFEIMILWGIVGILVTIEFVHEAWRRYNDALIDEPSG